MDHETLIGLGVQTILLVAAGYRLMLRNDWSNTAMREDVKGMKEELKGLSKVITTQAVQTTRIDNLTAQITMLQRNYEDLRWGNGIIERSRNDRD